MHRAEKKKSRSWETRGKRRRRWRCHILRKRHCAKTAWNCTFPPSLRLPAASEKHFTLTARSHNRILTTLRHSLTQVESGLGFEITAHLGAIILNSLTLQFLPESVLFRLASSVCLYSNSYSTQARSKQKLIEHLSSSRLLGIRPRLDIRQLRVKA